MKIDFETDPSRYRHWKIDVDGPIATLTIDVDENAGLFERVAESVTTVMSGSSNP